MKKIVLLSVLFLCIMQIRAQNYYMSAPEGFGAAATGGGNATPITVNNYTDFKNEIRSAGAKVILVSGTINIASGQNISEVVIDKTIIGLPGARLVNTTRTQAGSGILNLKNGSNNVIIRNLIFEGPGAYDVDGRDNLTADGCTNLWVDHCEFQDGIDGNFDIKNNSDNVTVSWCKFTYLIPPLSGGSGGSADHRFSNLVGASSTNAPADGHYSVTFQNCYWADGCKARMPRARNAELHILNCYYNVNVSGSAALGLGGGSNNLTCYVENSDFDNVTYVYQNASSDGGIVSLVFDNCINGVSNIGTVNPPSYSYTAFPVEDVASALTNSSCGAGATLQVTATGEISSLCDNLSTEDFSASGIKVYPTLVDNRLHVKIPSYNSGDANIFIYSLQGQKLYTESHIGAGEEVISMDMSYLSKGIYFCTIQTGNHTETVRFVKK